jgi:hypothetical protein
MSSSTDEHLTKFISSNVAKVISMFFVDSQQGLTICLVGMMQQMILVDDH